MIYFQNGHIYYDTTDQNMTITIENFPTVGKFYKGHGRVYGTLLTNPKYDSIPGYFYRH